MAIALFNKNINSAFVGDDTLQNIYLGDHLLWSSIEYDLIDENEYDRIDLLYSTDIHGYCKGGATKDCSTSSITKSTTWGVLKTSSNDNSMQSAELKLLASTNPKIKPLMLDGGDICRRKTADNTTQGGYDPLGAKLLNEMGTANYFLIVPGNNETDIFTINNTVTQAFDYYENTFRVSTAAQKACTACNIFYTNTGKLVYKPYRAAKIGSKKIGIIGVSWPAVDFHAGQDNRWIKYSYLDGEELFKAVQYYIDLLSANGFDYIGLVGHMAQNTGAGAEDEHQVGMNDIVINTSGLTFSTIAHGHNLNPQYILKDKNNNDVYMLAQPRCYFGWICHAKLTGSRLTSNVSITSTNCATLNTVVV